MLNDFNLDDTRDTGTSPEKALFAAIVTVAIQDARSALAKDSMVAREAMDFLMTNRSDPYLELLGYDPEIFRESLIKTNSKEAKHARMEESARENKARRAFRYNLQFHKEQGFKSTIPYNMIYESEAYKRCKRGRK